MKFIKNGIIFEPHSAFVEEQMKKSGYEPYETEKVKEKIEAKEVEAEKVEAEKVEKPKKKRK